MEPTDEWTPNWALPPLKIKQNRIKTLKRHFSNYLSPYFLFTLQSGTSLARKNNPKESPQMQKAYFFSPSQHSCLQKSLSDLLFCVWVFLA